MKNLIFIMLNKDIIKFFLTSILCLSFIIWIIQAVNYLDLVSEDGHSLKVYFSYTLFSLPKIISKILPIIFLISIFFVILKYETNNELIIFWTNGISKIYFINQILKISTLFFILQLVMNLIIVPYSLDKGRSYFRNSDIDLFSSILKEKKFIDTVKNLTIFIEHKDAEKLNNIFIKEEISKDQSQIIVAQSGLIKSDIYSREIILNNGKIIDSKNNNQNIINFDSFTFNLEKYSTNTVTHPKIQEMSSKKLFRCIILINEVKKNEQNLINNQIFFQGCNTEIASTINEEFLKRIASPIFIMLLGLTGGLIITSNKNIKNFRFINFFKFILGVIIIIISEITLSHFNKSLTNMIFYFFSPLIIFTTFYFFLLKTQKKNINDN